MGYHRAGFDEIVGVDIKPQPHFPFEFIQADWEEVLHYLPGLWERHGEQYAIHASPPCQAYSTMTKKWGRQDDHPDLVNTVRDALEEVGAPYVIENVVGAPLDKNKSVMLCGTMFQLRSQGYELRRHRLFECSWGIMFPPAMCNHTMQSLGVYGSAGGSSKRDGIKFAGEDARREGMGIDWMTSKELIESIPPAYTEYIGRQLIEHIKAKETV